MQWATRRDADRVQPGLTALATLVALATHCLGKRAAHGWTHEAGGGFRVGVSPAGGLGDQTVDDAERRRGHW